MNPPCNRKGRTGNPLPKGGAPQIYPNWGTGGEIPPAYPALQTTLSCIGKVAPRGYMRDGGRWSSRQSYNPAGESPVVSVARVGHVVIPQPGAGNQPGLAWCKRPGCHVINAITSVGAIWRSNEYGSLNIRE